MGKEERKKPQLVALQKQFQETTGLGRVQRELKSSFRAEYMLFIFDL